MKKEIDIERDRMRVREKIAVINVCTNGPQTVIKGTVILHKTYFPISKIPVHVPGHTLSVQSSFRGN